MLNQNELTEGVIWRDRNIAFNSIKTDVLPGHLKILVCLLIADLNKKKYKDTGERHREESLTKDHITNKNVRKKSTAI